MYTGGVKICMGKINIKLHVYWRGENMYEGNTTLYCMYTGRVRNICGKKTTLNYMYIGRVKICIGEMQHYIACILERLDMCMRERMNTKLHVYWRG